MSPKSEKVTSTSANQTAAITSEKPARKVDAIDFTKPFSITIDQTASRNNFSIFTGENHEKDAEAHASQVALSQDRSVAIFGPQIKVKAPPKEPTADDVPLNF